MLLAKNSASKIKTGPAISAAFVNMHICCTSGSVSVRRLSDFVRRLKFVDSTGFEQSDRLQPNKTTCNFQQRRSLFIYPKGQPSPAFRKTAAVPPGAAPSLEQLIARKKAQLYDPELDNPTNIGLPPLDDRTLRRIEKERHRYLKNKKFDSELERHARHRELRVPLDEVEREWLTSVGPDVIVNAANHYGIFRHLFKSAYFVPRVPLSVGYEAAPLHAPTAGRAEKKLQEHVANNADYVETIPVHRGNQITPSEARNAPHVSFNVPRENNNGVYAPSCWSLMLVGIDGHATDTTKEYLHWWVANIPPNGDVGAGEERVPYMQPLPYRGSGFHRYAFVLYKHDSPDKLPFDDVLPGAEAEKSFPSNSLPARTFSTFNFYEHYQDRLTPAGLAFFLTEWDESVNRYYYDVLQAKEPVFEYEHRWPYVNPHQNRYGVYLHGFNLYLDRYRNKKDMAEEMVKQRLKNLSPFVAEPPRPKFPQSGVVDKWIPSWKKTEIYKERLGWVKYRLLYNPLARWP